MGAVHVDIYKADRNYYHTSLSSEEDVFNILHILDAIKHDADEGNHEALAVVLDFEKLFLRNNICKEYYSILIGMKGYKINDDKGSDDYGKDILDLVSERLELLKEHCEEVLNNSIKEVVEGNKEIWLDWVNKNFKGKVNVKNKDKYLYKDWDDSSFYQRDFNQKYVVNSKMYKELEYPNDLQELINAQKKNEDKINELKKMKKNKKEKDELKKRIRFNIDLWQDMNLLKKHYGIKIKNNMVKDKIKFVSYSEDDLEIVEKNDNDFIIDEWQIQKIKEIALKVLTSKQLIIFNLFYISELTQKQIADLIGETQGHISRDLNISLEKIRKNL